MKNKLTNKQGASRLRLLPAAGAGTGAGGGARGLAQQERAGACLLSLRVLFLLIYVCMYKDRRI